MNMGIYDLIYSNVIKDIFLFSDSIIKEIIYFYMLGNILKS